MCSWVEHQILNHGLAYSSNLVRCTCSIASWVVMGLGVWETIVAVRTHLGILRASLILSLLLKLLLHLLRILKMTVLIKFSLWKTVDCIMRSDTLMLLILVQTGTTVRLSSEEISPLNVLAWVLVSFQNLLTAIASSSIFSILVVRCSRSHSLPGGISIEQISFIELIHNIRSRILSNSVGLLANKDIATRGIGISRTDWVGAQWLLLLMSVVHTRVTYGQRGHWILFVRMHLNILVYFILNGVRWLFLVHLFLKVTNFLNFVVSQSFYLIFIFS